jgi:hypothetical protein
MPLLALADFQLPGIPATMALAAVALIGYLFGRRSRANDQASQRTSATLERALADARQLEEITDEMLSATREALNQCRQLQSSSQLRPPHTAERLLAGVK